MSISTRYLHNNNKHVYDVSGGIAVKLSPKLPSGNGSRKGIRAVGDASAFHLPAYCFIYKCFNWSKFLKLLIIIINLKSSVQNKYM